jgi:protein ImuB
MITCVDIPSLPLQLVRRERPEWAGLPIAVVEKDEPQAPVLLVSRAAYESGVRPGLRYAAALGLCPALKAAPVPSAVLQDVRAELVGALHRTSPRVEADAERVGTFWVDPSGMTSIFGSLERFAEAVLAEIEGRSLVGNVVVGFTRLPCFAIARVVRSIGTSGSRARGGLRVLKSPAEEERLAMQVPLARLELPHETHAPLERLGIRTVGELVALPRGELSTRFGPALTRLHALFEGTLAPPMQAAAIAEPIEVSAELDPPDADEARLLFFMKGALHSLTSALASRRMGLGALRATLVLERAPGSALLANAEGAPETVGFVLRPSRASRDDPSLVELLRIRLSSLALPRAVERIVLAAEPAPIETAQLSMVGGTRKRDPDAIARGLARLRAAFGDDAVTTPKLEDAWLPEASFRWEPATVVRMPRPRAKVDSPPLVRRIFARPLPLPVRAERPVTEPALSALSGPYRIEAGWWEDARVARDYFYGERTDGALLWMFRDVTSGAWFLQGIVD